MDKIMYLYKITCPECGTVHFGFFGESDDDFCCDSEIKVIKGKRESIEECGYCTSLHHMPENSCEMISEILIEKGKPVVREIKKRDNIAGVI